MYKDKDYQKKYRESHKDKMKATGRAWYLNNLELSKERQRVRTANRTPIEKIAEKNYQNKWRADPEFKMYIEGQFKDGMTWNNWSLKGWHLDHKIPLAFFDLTDREQLLHAVHYTNLQPMWAKENIRKSNKVPTL